MMDYLIEPSSAEEGGRVADGCSFTRYFKTSVRLPYKSQFITRTHTVRPYGFVFQILICREVSFIYRRVVGDVDPYNDCTYFIIKSQTFSYRNG